MTAVWLACVGIWQTSDLSWPISIKIPLSRASQILDQLSKQAGIPLKTLGPVGDEVLFVDVTNQPMAKILKKIGETTYADWVINSDGSRTLIRNPADFDKREKENLKKDIACAVEWRSGLLKNIKQPFNEQSIRAAGYRMIHLAEAQGDEGSKTNDSACDPIRRAFLRAFKQVDMEQACKLTQYERLVYSTTPTPTQKALPSLIVTQLIDEQNLWAKALAKLELRDQQGKALELFPRDEEISTEGRNDPLSSSFQSRLPLRLEPQLALLSVYRDYWGSLVCTFDVYAEGGQKLVSINETIKEDTSEPNELMEAKNPFWGLSLPSPLESSKAFWQSSISQNVLTNLARPFYLQSESYEPLRPGNQEVLTEYAKKYAKSVIACLGDSDIVLSEDEYRELPKNEMRYPQSTMTQDPWWITIRPKYISERFSRKSFARYCGSLLINHAFDVRSYAQLAPFSKGLEIADSITRRVFKSDAELPENPLFRKLFASLTDSQFGRLLNGNIIPYRELTAEQIQLAKTITLGYPDALRIGGQAKTRLGQIDSTYEMPNGIFDGPGLSVDVVSHKAIYFTSMSYPDSWSHSHEDSDRSETFISSMSCGFGRPLADCGSLFKFLSGKRYTLKCYLSPTHWYSQDIWEPTATDFGAATRYRDLSKDQQEIIKTSVPFVDLESLRHKIKAILDQHPDLDEQTIQELRKTLDDIDLRISGD